MGLRALQERLMCLINLSYRTNKSSISVLNITPNQLNQSSISNDAIVQLNAVDGVDWFITT